VARARAEAPGSSWSSALSGRIDRRSASQAIGDDIRGAIESGGIPVGAKLPSEAQLAERYGVSRPVVREALRSLQALGLTTTRTGSGTYVESTTAATVPTDAGSGAAGAFGGLSARDLVEARPHIEVPAAEWAALRRSDAQAAALLALCGDMDAEHDPAAWVELDSRFHGAIAEACGNAVFERIVHDVRGALSSQSRIVNVFTDGRRASNEEHREIAEAIRARDAERAASLMAAHLERVARVMEDVSGGSER